MPILQGLERLVLNPLLPGSSPTGCLFNDVKSSFASAILEIVTLYNPSGEPVHDLQGMS